MSVSEPRVDVVVAIHDPSRPLQRVVDSLLESGLQLRTELRITAVCHNVEVAWVSERLDRRARAAIRFLRLEDGIHSAAGPFNLGLASASAEYISVIGSDDYLEPGALAAWLARADSGRYAAVIAPQRHASGTTVRTPPIRPRRSRALDPVRDRLAYRTAPLGLVRRDIIARLGLQFTPALSTGEDQMFSVRLWFSGERIAYGVGDPRYVVGDDAARRVTGVARPLADEMNAIRGLISSAWYVRESIVTRRVIATKIVRVHVFAAAASRSPSSWAPGERDAMSHFLAQLEDAAPGYAHPLSIADRRLLDALVDPTTPSSTIGALASARRRFGHPATVFTRDPRGFFAADGPLRFMVASALL